MGTIDLNDLNVFVTVVETASFSGAAKRLALPKSSVSRAIARLEDATGVRALHRTTRQVSLSAEGKALYEKVRGDITALRRSVGELPELDEQPSGRMRVTSVVDMSEFFADVVARFVNRYPAVEVDLHLTNAYVDLVADGIDLALRFATKRLKDSTLNARKLYPSYVQLFASPSYLARRGVPRTPRDLEQHDWVVYKPAPEFRIEGGGPPTDVVTHGRIACDNFTFLRAALVNGCGIGFLGSFHSDADVAAGRLVRVLPKWSSPISSFWAVWPGPRQPPPKVSEFIDLLLETVKADPHWPATVG